MFIDEAQIRVKAGDGGNGCVAMSAAVVSNAIAALDGHQTFQRIRIAAESTAANPTKTAMRAMDGPGMR